MLEGTAAGLNRKMIQNKKESYRKAFLKFNIQKISKFDSRDVDRLMNGDTGIIRNQRKIEAVINNAVKILEIKKEFGSFDKYMWSFVKGKKLPFHSKESLRVAENMSETLKKRGFKFTGPAACHTFMHVVGMVKIHKHLRLD